ncbi:Diguanylate cyclase (GGDEF) domain-containing protein [Pseudomonas sp. 8Z]|uniref:EAL domain-containing protein n=1 Tax=Pseudomonas sp. 8Z TaxID=2653166 RepID=UPI0012F0D904|nr:EAL domain-containing protein [Pseudomonas sp. 8Z]VXC85627.1 Diguanylate cyclase (GGDEF) domain-containing protein [Pseudomonas sp. 8Z]
MARWLSLLLLLLSLQSWAEAQLPLIQPTHDALSSPFSLNHRLLLEDPDGQLDAAQALDALLQQGKAITGSAHIGYSSSTWWHALRLQLPAGESVKLILATPLLDSAQVWLLSNEGMIGPLRSGSSLPFDERGQPYPHLMLDLPPLDATPHTLLIRTQSHASLDLPLQLISSTSSQHLIAHSWLLNGLLIGALLGLTAFYLIRFSTLREAQLAYFCLAALCVAAFTIGMYNAAGLLADSDAQRSELLIQLPMVGILIFSTLFLSHSLRLPTQRLRWLNPALFAIILLVCVGGHLTAHPQTYRLLNLLILATGLYQLTLLLLAVHLRRTCARSFLLCWGPALPLMLLIPLNREGLISLPSDLQALYAFLPSVSMLMFGTLLDKKHERTRRALLSTQTRAIDNLEQYQALFRHSSEGIMRCNHAGQLLEANPSLCRMLGENSTQLLTKQLPELLGEVTWTELLTGLENSGGAISRECQLRDINGQQRWVYLSLHQQPTQDSIVGIIVDLNERHTLEERLQHLATHDALTGLYNRRELERLLSSTLNGETSPPFSHLLCLSLDRFKLVNDLCGHLAGDQLLKQLAKQLQRSLPEHAELARIGGDEFAILLREPNDAAAQQQAELLRRNVEQFVFTWQNRPFRLHASIGLLTLAPDMPDWETALNWANNAAQQAKHQGRNRVHQFNPADGALLDHQRQLQWITRLRDATEHDHFELFQQAVTPLQKNTQGLHYEVLLRYRDPKSGERISPGQFLDAAARYGFLGAIDRWVIEHLCAWLANNPRHLANLVQVNVNLSAESLLDKSFHTLLNDVLQRHNLPASKLCIEVTEMVALGELGVSAKWIKELRSQGLKVALDDFGSGFASYAYLRHLPLDILKIDGSFIRDIDQDPINQAMVGSMQQIATQLGLSTVAEFVETQQSMNCLHRLGIDYAQGYHIGKPQPLALLADAPQPA